MMAAGYRDPFYTQHVTSYLAENLLEIIYLHMCQYILCLHVSIIFVLHKSNNKAIPSCTPSCVYINLSIFTFFLPTSLCGSRRVRACGYEWQIYPEYTHLSNKTIPKLCDISSHEKTYVTRTLPHQPSTSTLIQQSATFLPPLDKCTSSP